MARRYLDALAPVGSESDSTSKEDRGQLSQPVRVIESCQRLDENPAHLG